MSVGLDAALTTTQCETTPRCQSALLRTRGDGQVPERAWLDLLAEVTVCPPPTFPCERIARLLCVTFESRACSYSLVVDDVVVGGLVSSGGGPIAPQVRHSPGPPNAVGALAVAMWDGIPLEMRCPDLLSLPESGASAGKLAFVVGRNGTFRSTDRRLAATLWILLTAFYTRYRAEVSPEAPSGESISLTAREAAVLAQLGEGLTAAAIACQLQISVRTVHKHLERIYVKLGVTNRLAAVLAARRLDILPLRLDANKIGA